MGGAGGPVSYTHLDVYKRQAFSLITKRINRPTKNVINYSILYSTETRYYKDHSMTKINYPKR